MKSKWVQILTKIAVSLLVFAYFYMGTIGSFVWVQPVMAQSYYSSSDSSTNGTYENSGYGEPSGSDMFDAWVPWPSPDHIGEDNCEPDRKPPVIKEVEGTPYPIVNSQEYQIGLRVVATDNKGVQLIEAKAYIPGSGSNGVVTLIEKRWGRRVECPDKEPIVYQGQGWVSASNYKTRHEFKLKSGNKEEIYIWVEDVNGLNTSDRYIVDFDENRDPKVLVTPKK